PSSCPSPRLLNVEREVVDDERRLQSAVLGADEVDLNGLPFIRGQIETLLNIPAIRIEIRIRGQRGQDRSAAIANLHVERIERGGGRGLGRIDVQPER